MSEPAPEDSTEEGPEAGEQDARLAALLGALQPRRRPGTFTLVAWDPAFAMAEIEASVREDEGVSVVVPLDAAHRLGLPVRFAAAWITLGVASDVHDVGLTAAVSTALAHASIPCNVLAGLHHDHLLVPVADAALALRVLGELAAEPTS